MGVQLNGTIKVWWPFTVVPRAYAIKGKANRWLPMVKDITKTWHVRSVNSQRLTIKHGRWCLFENLPGGGGRNLASNDSYGVTRLDRWAEDLPFLTVKKVQDEGDGVLAVAAASRWRKNALRMSRLGSLPGLLSSEDSSWVFSSFNLLLPLRPSNQLVTSDRVEMFITSYGKPSFIRGMLPIYFCMPPLQPKTNVRASSFQLVLVVC